MRRLASWCAVAAAAAGCSAGAPGKREGGEAAASASSGDRTNPIANPIPNPSSAPTTEAASSDSRTASLSPAPLPPPAGWMAWSLAPRGCTVWIPESEDVLDGLAELEWRACPFLPTGCAALGATWARRTGWGFGGRLAAVAAGARTYLSMTRQIDDGVWETVLLGGATALRPVAAWRQRLPEAGCVLGSVSLTAAAAADGRAPQVRAALPILRGDDEVAPLVVWGEPEAMSRASEPAPRRGGLAGLAAAASAPPTSPAPRVATFGGTGAEVLGREVALSRGELLVVWEHEDRFALRDLASGHTSRPAPTWPSQASDTSGRRFPARPPTGQPAFRALLEATPVDGAVLFNAWTGDLGSVWAADRAGHTTPLLAEPRASFDRFVTDGHRAAWLRSTGLRALNTFDAVELWTAHVERGALTSPRRVRKLGGGVLPLLSLGEGWVALWQTAPPEGAGPPAGNPTVTLVRLSDGELRRLPEVPQLSWDGGSGGLAIASGAVWARASLRGAAGNDYRLLARFELEALPKGSLR